MRNSEVAEELVVGDWVFFNELWCHRSVFAKVIEVDGFHFRLWFPDANLELENQSDGEWFRPRHIDSVYRKAFDI